MKKLLFMLCLITSIFSMATLTYASSETKNYSGYTEEDLKSNSESLYTSLSAFTDEEMTQYLSSGDEITVGAVQSWSNVKNDLGEYVGIGKFTVKESKDAITTELVVDYTKRDLVLTIAYDENLTVTSITADKRFTIGEIMSKAGLNTMMGMGTVFVILILICILISFFSVINKWEENMKSKKKSSKTEAIAAPSIPVVEEVVEEELVDDLELVAAISAAIAATMNTSTDGFVVRSIKRRTTKMR